MSDHRMLTRSQKKIQNINDAMNGSGGNNDTPDIESGEENDIDEYGNIENLIDYGHEKQKLKPKKLKLKKKTKINRNNKSNNMEELCLSYMVMNMMNQFKGNLHIISSDDISPKKRIKTPKSRKSPVSFKENITNESDESDESDEDLEIKSNDSDKEDEEESPTLESEESLEDSCDENILEDEDNDDEETINTCSDDSNDSEDIEFDELDEAFVELENEYDIFKDEDENINYFHKLDVPNKENLLHEIKRINEINDLNMPLKFKIYQSDMDVNTKAIAIKNIDKLSEMDVSTGEYSKMDKWISGLISIPFNNYIKLPIDNENTIEKKREFILNTKSILDESIYGHNDAKTHILQVIGKWIKNPNSQGNVLALQGPMGNGKTTLVKEGISKAIGRPFAFIALGGQSDSSVFEGHSYTYEGSHWGRIIDILIESKCMNPVIYFDELDKVSETYKGEEIIHMLTHLTDPSQNSLFQDNYYPGINIDLSKVLFIFSFNDESKINRVLKDRMYVINTKGFNAKDKIKICRNYILPELYDTYLFKPEDIIINDDILEYIIDKYTDKEEGVRNLKRCIESIISKINIYYLTFNEENDIDDIKLNFKIKDFKLPYKINTEDINDLLKLKTDEQPPPTMYM